MKNSEKTKKLTKIIAVALCICLCLCPLTGLSFAAQKNYTQIGDVKFYGARYLEKIDLSAMVNDFDTLAEGTLWLVQIFESPETAIENYNYIRVANFEFSEEEAGAAVLSDYPGASAPIDPGDYMLYSPKGNLFDNVPYYVFSAKEYYQNTPASAFGLRLNAVGLPEFSDFKVVRAEGETVYTMSMVLAPELVEFYDDINPEGEIEIDCKYSYDNKDTFAVISARPASYDKESGLLTIELLDKDGNAGVNLHNFRFNDEDYGYVFSFTFFRGLFTCGEVRSAHSFVQISGKVIEGMPERVFTGDTTAGKVYSKLYGKLWSEKPARKNFAKFSLVMLSAPICLGLMRAGSESVEAFGGNALYGGIMAVRHILNKYMADFMTNE